jgi:hypothetical protein
VLWWHYGPKDPQDDCLVLLGPSASSDQVMIVAVVCSCIISAGAEIAFDAGVMCGFVFPLGVGVSVPCKPHLLNQLPRGLSLTSCLSNLQWTMGGATGEMRAQA